MPFLGLNWQVTHIIDEHSPLRGYLRYLVDSSEGGMQRCLNQLTRATAASVHPRCAERELEERRISEGEVYGTRAIAHEATRISLSLTHKHSTATTVLVFPFMCRPLHFMQLIITP
jgi:hypothetical protein